MSTLRILWAEICYRKLNFALSLAAVAVAAALFVAGPVLIDGYRRETTVELDRLQRSVTESAGKLAATEQQAAAELAKMEDETRRLMRDLGFNLMLVHRDEDIVQFLSHGLPTLDMPQQYVEKLAADTRLTYVTHLVGTLRGLTELDGRKVRLVGFLPEANQKHMLHDTPMGYTIARGSVLLGYRLGENRKPGQTLELGGQSFTIAKILPEQGTDEDSTIGMNLADAQTLLDKPGKVNVILALECRCSENALPKIRKQMNTVLPETQVLRDQSRADARVQQRALVKEKYDQLVAQHKSSLRERQATLDTTASRRQNILGLMQTLATVFTPLVLIASGIWVGLMAWINVRQRQTEIGVLRAIGKQSTAIAGLLLGKAVIVGAIGAAIGGLVGLGLARWLSIETLEIAPQWASLPWETVLVVLLGSPVLSALASYLPTLYALSQDPAVVLRDA